MVEGQEFLILSDCGWCLQERFVLV